LDRELDDVVRIEILRIRRKRSSGRVLDSLIDRQDRYISCAGETTGRIDRVQAAEDVWIAVGLHPNPVDKVTARELQVLLWDGGAGVIEQSARLVTQKLS